MPAMPRQHTLAAILLLGPLATALPAQTPAPAAPPHAEPRSKPAAPAFTGRAELARVYLALERLVAEHGDALDAPTLERVNRTMDLATDHYFAADNAGTILRVVEALGAADPRLAGLAPRLSLRPEATVVRTTQREFKAKLGLACPLPEGAPAKLDLRILAVVPEGDTEVTTVIGEVRGWDPAATPTLDLTLQQPMFRERTRTLRVVMGLTEPGQNEHDAPDAFDMGYLSATLLPMEAIREVTLKRLDMIPPELARRFPRAMAACRARAATLTDAPGPESTLNLVSSPAPRAKEVEREVADLESGADPYAAAVGDFWLTLGDGGGGLPARLYVPERPEGVDPKTPRPLVIALHGAGGDENLWISGYGGGNLRAALARHDAIGVSPLVGMLGFGPATFDAIVESVAAWHTIDRSRIYVIGHSMGGGAAVAWARLRPGAIAGVCSVAGIGALAGAPRLPPTLDIAGALDTLCTPARLRADAERAAAQGLPVEYREVPHYGHVLVLGKTTPEAIDWLMTKRLPTPPPPAPTSPAVPAKSP